MKQLLDLATLAACRKQDQRHFRLGAAAQRADGVLVSAGNGPAQGKLAGAHAEARLARKLDYGAEILVIRVRRDGSLGMAKPCMACQQMLEQRKPLAVWYSTENGTIERV